MIKIGRQYIETKNGKARCYCNIEIENELKNVWFEVDEKYKEYLAVDRADAYVIGFIHYAMKNNYCIECEMPITDELLHNIKEILMPSLVKYDKNMHRINISAKTIEPYEGGTHVGTGLSCGVDSFYSISKHFNNEYPSLKLTDVCINNVGSFDDCYDEHDKEEVKNERYHITEQVAKEIGLNLIKTDSNFWNEINQTHLLTHTYSSVFAIYMLQKYWKTYYYSSSGHDFACFNLQDNSNKDCADYELLSLQCLSTSSIRIYSDGGEKNRIEKTAFISDYAMAHKYLHVCINDTNNCGVCSKCKRTIMSLDALNKLELFHNVFDLEKYKKEKRAYDKWLWEQHYLKDDMNEPTYQMIHKRKDYKVSIASKIMIICKNTIKSIIKKTFIYEKIKRR